MTQYHSGPENPYLLLPSSNPDHNPVHTGLFTPAFSILADLCQSQPSERYQAAIAERTWIGQATVKKYLIGFVKMYAVIEEYEQRRPEDRHLKFFDPTALGIEMFDQGRQQIFSYLEGLE